MPFLAYPLTLSLIFMPVISSAIAARIIPATSLHPFLSRTVFLVRFPLLQQVSGVTHVTLNPSRSLPQISPTQTSVFLRLRSVWMALVIRRSMRLVLVFRRPATIRLGIFQAYNPLAPSLLSPSSPSGLTLQRLCGLPLFPPASVHLPSLPTVSI